MNWGYRLMFTFIAFASLMTFLVYKAVHTDFQLVEKEYYKSELSYQEVIDGTKRVNDLSSPVNVTQDDTGIILQLPEEMKNKQLEGNVWFYCAYDAKKDRKLNLQPDVNGVQIIPSGNVSPGKYIVKVQWKLDKDKYYSTRQITIR